MESFVVIRLRYAGSARGADPEALEFLSEWAIDSMEKDCQQRMLELLTNPEELRTLIRESLALRETRQGDAHI